MTKTATTVTALSLTLLASFFVPAASAGALAPSGCAVQVGSSGTCQLVATGAGPDANWNGVVLSTGVDGVNDNGGTPTTEAELVGSGAVSGTFNGDVLPVSWVFSAFTGDGVADAYNWTLSVYGTPMIAQEQPQGGSVSTRLTLFSTTGTGNVDGTSVIGSGQTAALEGQFSGFQIVLDVQDTNGFPFNLTVGADSTIHLNSVAGTPEPATMILGGAGLLGVLTLRRRNRRG